MWYEYVDNINKQFLLKLYNSVPKLENINILKTIISSNLDKATIIFKMPYYADNPPVKWITSKFNTTIVELDVCFIKEMKYESNKKKSIVNMEIFQKDDLLNFRIIGDINIKIIAEACKIQRIEGMITKE